MYYLLILSLSPSLTLFLSLSLPLTLCSPPLTFTLLSACSDIPELAASDMIAMFFSPSMNLCFSFRLSISSDTSDSLRSWYCTVPSGRPTTLPRLPVISDTYSDMDGVMEHVQLYSTSIYTCILIQSSVQYIYTYTCVLDHFYTHACTHNIVYRLIAMYIRY